VLTHASHNKLTAGKLSIVFCNVLLPSSLQTTDLSNRSASYGSHSVSTSTTNTPGHHRNPSNPGAPVTSPGPMSSPMRGGRRPTLNTQTSLSGTPTASGYRGNSSNQNPSSNNNLTPRQIQRLQSMQSVLTYLLTTSTL